MPEEVNQPSENLVLGTEIIRCIHFMQEQVKLNYSAKISDNLSPIERNKLCTQAQTTALDELAKRLAKASSPFSAESLLDPTQVYSQEFWLEVMEQCKDITDDAQFFFHFGAHQIPEEMKTFAIAWHLRPEKLFQNIPMVFSGFDEWDIYILGDPGVVSRLAVIKWRSSVIPLLPAEIRVRWIKTTCQIYQGILSTLPTYAPWNTGTNVQVFEIHCLSEGAKWCEWEITWRSPRLIYREILPRTRAWWLGCAISLLILMYADWKVPPIQFILTLLATILPLTIVFYYQRAKRLTKVAEEGANASERTERILREQRVLSQRQYERSERANDELQTINQTLEQRVTERTHDIEQRTVELTAALTENELLYSELEVKSKQLEIASRHKTEFLANMSHELRTPLNAIIGFSDVLLEKMFGELNAKQTDYLQDILSSGRHLLGLINDILDISKVEAGRMELERTRFALGDVLENSLKMIHERADRHGIALNLDVDPNVGLIEADERMVKQVIVNLLSNAVKFTPSGGHIDMSAQLMDGEVYVSVRDTGIGIAPDDQSRIFDEFQQARQGAVKSEEGTGLGLTLSKKFVELHGGRIWVESDGGNGSTFTFTLPLRESVSFADPSIGKNSGPIVLLVEDDARAIELLTLYLTAADFNVAVARDGDEGLAIARRIHPAAITLDIMLPHVDGWDFLARAKADPEIANIPVIIVSVLDEHGKGFALGAADSIVKPANRDDLLTILHRLTDGSNSADGLAKILIIDDDPLALELMEASLQPEGYTVLKARGGQEGVAVAGQESPSLIILDLLMPNVDGFDVVDRLRANPVTASIPIVIMTSKSMTREEKERLNGQISYLARKAEFNRAGFVEMVRSFIV